MKVTQISSKDAQVLPEAVCVEVRDIRALLHSVEKRSVNGETRCYVSTASELLGQSLFLRPQHSVLLMGQASRLVEFAESIEPTTSSSRAGLSSSLSKLRGVVLPYLLDAQPS